VKEQDHHPVGGDDRAWLSDQLAADQALLRATLGREFPEWGAQRKD
jgi:hypothetical protein